MKPEINTDSTTLETEPESKTSKPKHRNKYQARLANARRLDSYRRRLHKTYRDCIDRQTSKVELVHCIVADREWMRRKWIQSPKAFPTIFGKILREVSEHYIKTAKLDDFLAAIKDQSS